MGQRVGAQPEAPALPLALTLGSTSAPAAGGARGRGMEPCVAWPMQRRRGQARQGRGSKTSLLRGRAKGARGVALRPLLTRAGPRSAPGLRVGGRGAAL